MKYSVLIFGIVASGLLVGCDNPRASSASKSGGVVQSLTPEQVAQYTCPMHPHYISDDPEGHCPICGMNLVPVAQEANQDPGEILYYKNPMGKPDTSPVPKKDSMGMDYIPVYARDVSSGGVTVPSEMIQTMGVRTAKVQRAAILEARRFFGTIEPDQSLETKVVSRSEGWIEALSIQSEGASVEPGALLYEIYSPDLMAAQKDYLNALVDGREKRLRALGQRLISLGMQPRSIEALRDTQAILERVPIYAELGGTVTSLHVRQGDYVTPGMKVLTLQSYDTVWVIGSVPEQDIPFVTEGQTANLYIPSASVGHRKGEVAFVYPQIDPKSRTRPVRIVLDNQDGTLLPGAYTELSVTSPHGDGLVIPSEAILYDQDGAHVIIALQRGRYTSRLIETGVRTGENTQIISGLNEGEEVVTSGQFLLDSEVNLREGLNNRLSPKQPLLTPDTPLSEFDVDDATLAEIDHITDLALYFHEALVDQYQIVPDYLSPALKLVGPLRAKFADTKLGPILDGSKVAIESAKAAVNPNELSDALGELMTTLEPWLMGGAPTHYRDSGLTLYQDPQTGRQWLQSTGPAQNPYTDAEPRIIPWPDAVDGNGERPSEDSAPLQPNHRH